MSAVRTKVNDEIKEVNNIFAYYGDIWKTVNKGWTKTGDSWRVHFEKVSLPENLIVFFNDTLSGNWKALNGVDDTLDLITNSVYLRGDTAQGDSEAGSNTHAAPTASGYSGNSTNKKVNEDDDERSKNTEKYTATHTYNHSHTAINSEPPYYTLIPAKGGSSLPTTAVMFMDGDSVPSGWSSIFGTIGDKFVKCGDTAGDSGGAATHAHAYSGYSGYRNIYSSPDNRTGGAYGINHRHTISHTHAAISNYPEWYGLIPISPDSEATEIPSGVVAFFKGSTIPDEWTLFGAISGGKFIRLQATSGGTGGVNNHTHSWSGNSGGYSNNSGASVNTMFGGSGYTNSGHYHAVSHSHASADNIPLHRSLLVCKKD